MKILLLKAPKCPEDPYEKELKLAGYDPHFLQVLHFEFINSDRLSTALHAAASSYSGIAFTSQTAVEACQAARISATPTSKSSSSDQHDGRSEVEEIEWKEKLADLWRSLPVFVVGKATGEAVNQLGLKSCVGATSGNAEELSTLIVQHFEPSLAASDTVRPLLFPCSRIRKDTLPAKLSAAGVPLEEVVCYDTMAHPLIAENIENFLSPVSVGEMVGVVFFSPSGVSFVLDQLLQKCAERDVTVQLMAIGKTSATALTGAGHAPSAVAKAPNPRGLLDAVNSAK